MILRLTEQLDVPLRERNVLLLAGGYAPAYPQRGLEAPELARVREALHQVLTGHQPYPAIVINRWWELIDANASVTLLTDGAAPWLLEPPINVLRLSLHPDGVAPRILNLAEWRGHLLPLLHSQAQATGDPLLLELYDELLAYPGDSAGLPAATDVVLPLRLRVGDKELSFFNIRAVVGTATDVTVEELAIESFYPADAATMAALQALGSAHSPAGN